eukprot:4719958-Pyramimonas_sp.AAC.1
MHIQLKKDAQIELLRMQLAAANTRAQQPKVTKPTQPKVGRSAIVGKPFGGFSQAQKEEDSRTPTLEVTK